MAAPYQPAFPPDHYLNRELSWLEFNARVLEEAADKTTPLLERLKFAAIFSSNLDEFFEVRVAGLQQQLYAGIEPQDYGADGIDPAERLRFVLLAEIIAARRGDLFGGFKVLAHTVFRVTRNTDLDINEDDAEDLLQTIEETLRQRILGDAVRLEILASGDDRFAQMLMGALDLRERDVYRVNGPVEVTALMALHRGEGFRSLRDEPLVPRPAPAFASGENPFDVIRAEDVLVDHPYESFGAVVDFIDRAADDPQV